MQLLGHGSLRQIYARPPLDLGSQTPLGVHCVVTNEEIKNALGRLIADLEGALALTVKASKPVELDQATLGRLSRMEAMQQQKMVEANRRAQRIRVEQARAALHRLEAGEYGDCLSCGESILERRLLARPETPFCLECQSQREPKSPLR